MLSTMKEKWKIPEIDKLSVNQSYAFSFNPEDNHQYFGKHNRVEHFREAIDIMFNKALMPYCAIDCFVETSKTGRLHLHGILDIRNVRNFVINAIPYMKDKGTFEIDTLGDINRWYAYCSKMQLVMCDDPRESMRITTKRLPPKSTHLEYSYDNIKDKLLTIYV